MPVCSSLFPSLGRTVTAPFTLSPSRYNGAFSRLFLSSFTSTVGRSSVSSSTMSMSTGVEKKYDIVVECYAQARSKSSSCALARESGFRCCRQRSAVGGQLRALPGAKTSIKLAQWCWIDWERCRCRKLWDKRELVQAQRRCECKSDEVELQVAAATSGPLGILGAVHD